jgi:hypothetical protein
MKRHNSPRVQYGCILAASALLFATGCATPESNPTTPKADRGYADFYPDPPLEVYWEIDEVSPENSESRVLYSRFKAPENGILRLEMSPGPHQLRVSFSNLATEGPVEVKVQIEPQKITPVPVTYSAAGSTYVREVEDKMRDPGRRRKVTDSQYQIFKLAAQTRAVEEYQPKQSMNYAH